jgi:cytochrome c-type biogenesis protein CcmE
MSESVVDIALPAPRQANKKLKFIIGGAAIILAIVYLVVTGVQSAATYFLTVGELRQQESTMLNRNVRVSGQVDETTIAFDNRDLVLTFDIFDETGQRLPVVFNGPKPDQMRDGAEAIVEGKWDGQEFTANTLLLKCPSRYEEGTIEEIQVEAVR